MGRWTKEHQPKNRRKPSGRQKEVLSARVKPETKEYFRHSEVGAGEVLDEYADNKK